MTHHLAIYHKPQAWVAAYVDYSSKYGLGFLNSDGRSVVRPTGKAPCLPSIPCAIGGPDWHNPPTPNSAGVYFNDSTKLVVDASGRHARYIERSSSSARGGSSRCVVRGSIDWAMDTTRQSFCPSHQPTLSTHSIPPTPIHPPLHPPPHSTAPRLSSKTPRRWPAASPWRTTRPRCTRR